MRAWLGQLLFTGISGPALTSDEKKFIVEHNVGGISLFGRNVVEPKQLHELCREIQSLSKLQADRLPLFIGIDQEGGRVARLRAPFTVWPAPALLGKLDLPTLSFHYAHAMGLELAAMGINLNFAPCVDVLTRPENKAIGDRALSSSVEIVEKHASALARGYFKAGLLTSAKHFPGHGNTVVDSHDELPVENKTLVELEQCELAPFKKAIRARVDMVMIAHLLFPHIDPQWPASLSEIFVKNILQKNLRFKGLVITDDLGMGALVKHHSTEEIALRTLAAGSDLLLYCNDFSAPPRALQAIENAIDDKRIDENDLKLRYQKIVVIKQKRLASWRTYTFEEALQIVAQPKHLQMAEIVKTGLLPEGYLQQLADDQPDESA